MAIKRTLALVFGFIGITLTVFSLSTFQAITGAVIGANSASKFVGILGICFMIAAVVIERYELKKK